MEHPKDFFRRDLTNEQYHDSDTYPHFSSSDIKEVVKNSALHWALKQDEPRKEPTEAMLLGSAVHGFILEPEKNEFMRGLPNKLQRKAWAEMEEQAAKDGKILLKEGTYDQAEKLAEVALRTNTDLQDFIKHKNFLPEVSVFGECENTGLSIKCRPDGMLLDEKNKKATLMDIKTTYNVSPYGFSKEIKNWNYGVQAVFYMNCCKSIGLEVDRFIFFAVCKDTGICTKHTLSELYLKYAEKQMFKAMAELLDAQVSGKFSTGWPDENVIHLPSYLEDEVMDEM